MKKKAKHKTKLRELEPQNLSTKNNSVEDLGICFLQQFQTNYFHPLITRFRVIQFKSYTEKEFVKVAVNVLDREEGVVADTTLIIADGVFNNLKVHIWECIRTARFTKNDSIQVNKIIDTFVEFERE